jgi:hypothetical protein
MTLSACPIEIRGKTNAPAAPARRLRMERRVGRIMNRSPFTGQQQCEERTCKIPYPGGEFLIPTRSGIKFVCCPWRRTLLVQFWYSTGIIKACLMSEPFLSYTENLGSERALPLFPK